MPESGPAWQVIGLVRSVRAPQREVRVDADPRAGEAIESMEWANFRLPNAAVDTAPLRCRVDGLRYTQRGWVFTLSAGLPRDRLAALRGAELLADAGTLPPDDARVVDDVRDLIGFAVYDEAGNRLGRISQLYQSPGQDTMVIERPGQPGLMVPVIPQVVLAVDLDAESVEVGPLGPYAVEE